MGDPITTGLMIGGSVLGAYGKKRAAQKQANQIGSDYVSRPYVSQFRAAPRYSGYEERAERIRQIGDMEHERADEIAKGYKDDALKALALSHPDAIEAYREGRILASDATTGVMFSGGTSEDINEILAEIDATAEYNALSRLWEGKDSARTLKYKARLARYDGDVAQIDAGYQAGVEMAEGEFQNAISDYEDKYSRYADNMARQQHEMDDQANLDNIAAAKTAARRQAQTAFTGDLLSIGINSAAGYAGRAPSTAGAKAASMGGGRGGFAGPDRWAARTVVNSTTRSNRPSTTYSRSPRFG